DGIATDEAIAADAAELVDGRTRADVGEVLDADVTAERGMRPEDGPAPDVAVVGDVHVGHEQIVVFDRRLTAAASRAPVDGDELAEDIAAPDSQGGGFALVLQVL